MSIAMLAPMLKGRRVTDIYMYTVLVFEQRTDRAAQSRKDSLTIACQLILRFFSKKIGKSNVFCRTKDEFSII